VPDKIAVFIRSNLAEVFGQPVPLPKNNSTSPKGLVFPETMVPLPFSSCGAGKIGVSAAVEEMACLPHR
jgi:hypothetical protein